MDLPWKNLMSNTEHLRRNAQSCIRTISPALRQWCGESLPRLFGNPALMVWPHHTYCVWPCWACQKIPLHCTEYNRPMTLAPTNEESAWTQWEKNLIGKKKSLDWVKWSAHVVSLDTNNLKRETLAKVEKEPEEGYSWLNYYLLSILQTVLPS